jgi:hypothetical protein
VLSFPDIGFDIYRAPVSRALAKPSTGCVVIVAARVYDEPGRLRYS